MKILCAQISKYFCLVRYLDFQNNHCIIRNMKLNRNEQLDSVLINLMAHAPSTPSWELALEYRKFYSAAGIQKNQVNRQNALKFDTHSFKPYGSGVMLYFSLLEAIFYTFLIMSLFSIPSLLCNIKGNGLDIYGGESFAKSLMRSSLANQRYEQFEKIQENQSIYIDMEVSRIIIISSDILCSIAFFYFLVYWKIRSDEIVEELISEDALPSYYTLIIKKLPNTLSERALRHHFQNLGGEIAQISIVYDYEDILNEIKLLLELVDEYSGAGLQKKEQIYDKIEQKYQKIKEIYKNTIPKPMLALITFESMQFKKKVHDIYKYQVCPKQLLFQGKMLKVKNCKIEPSSIMWENFHLKFSKEIKQGVCIYFLLAVILLSTLIALFLVNARSTNNIEKQQKFRDNIDYGKQYTYDQAIKDGSLEVVFNFCSKLDYQTFVFEHRQFCEPYFKSYEQKVGGTIIVALLVVTINILCNWIIYELANYRRYKTKTEKSRFLIINIFILYFINSALLILFIRLEIDEFSLGKLITSILKLPMEQFSTQAYNDFNRKWYINIGSQILMIHALSLISSPFIQIFLGWLLSKYRHFMAKRAKTQKQMNETLKDSQFDFQTFYAMILNSCFFTMFYGNAMPVLYFISIMAILCIYIASYIVFKYFSCKPIMFDHTLNIVISKLLCIALVMHQFTSILYFYTQDIFPLSNFMKDQKNQIAYFGNKFSHGIVFLVLGVVFSVFGVNYARACKMIRYYLSHKSDEDSAEQIRDCPKLFHEVFPNSTSYSQRYSYLSSYKMQMNPFYLDICYTMTILKMFNSHFNCTRSMHDILQQNINRSASKMNSLSLDQQNREMSIQGNRKKNLFEVLREQNMILGSEIITQSNDEAGQTERVFLN